jgi:phosphatidylserine/phosphatidylglycerophosphate/cardiolipin synthase-like enzyme
MHAGRSLWLLLSLAMGTLAALLWSDALRGAVAAPPILIDSVLYDGYALDDADEAVRLANAGPSPVDVGGWRLSDGGASAAVIPAGIAIQPGAALWLARDAAAFRFYFGRDPDLELSPWPGFANAGDEVLLFDAGGALVDALVYADGDTSQPGWSGAAVEPYTVAAVFAGEGQILYRRRDQTTGAIAPDTGTAADWAQSPADAINGRKVRYPGWASERFFFPPQITATAALTVAIAPDNAYAAIVEAIESAQKSIHLSSLTLENMALSQALAAAAGRGVAVTALLEGSPPGGLTNQERFVCQLIEGAGGACWFMTADPARRIHDRYRFLHAKYIVIDGQVAIVGSENFSPDSLPYDDKSDGTWGRRGVFLLIDAPAVAAQLEVIFAADLNAAHADLTRWTAADDLYGAPPPGFLPDPSTGGVTYTVRFPTAATFYGTFTVEIIQSPENSLRDVDGLLGLVGRAEQGDRLYVQQLNERPYWGATTSNPVADPNPRLEAYLDAARRGAVVRIMLDSFFDDPDSAVSNAATCAYANEMARNEMLPLRCQLGNPTGLGIHNKMVLAQIDGQGYVHVGSINGTEISHKGNRELALQVQSDAAYAYLVGLFQGDAPRVVYLPMAARLFEGAVNHVLISEIVYDTPGPDEAEFVELVNPTGAAIDLTGYALGDAVLRTDFEDMRLFPPGTIIPANATLVVALSGAAFRDEFGLDPQFEIVDSDPAVPDMIDEPDWGDPEALFQLGNSGDEVLLRRGDWMVDVVTYGDGGYPGMVRCDLLVPPAHTLERHPYWNDTDVCPVDFRAWPFPSPGHLP